MDPAGRPGSAVEVRAELESLAVPAAVGSAPAPERSPGPVRIPRWALPAALSLVMIVAGGAWLGRRHPAVPGAAPAPAPAVAGIPAPLPGNTAGELYVRATETRSGPRERIAFSFEPGEEQLNVHAGTWTLEGGRLHAVQAGNETDEETLVPRTYVAHRYFARDDLALEASISLKDVSGRFGLPAGVQQFAELSYRVRDLQVSVMAPRGGTYRLVWRYLSDKGREVEGTSAADLAFDEVPVEETEAPARVKLVLRAEGGGVVAEGFVNGRRFADVPLPGFSGRPGKLALGCRNLECWFSDVAAEGRPEPPQR
jgi:serine/threonine-protein kinase